MKSDLIDLTVQKLHETEKAVLVTVDVPDNAVWLAKSQIEICPCAVGGLYTVTMPEWLALQRGMI